MIHWEHLKSCRCQSCEFDGLFFKRKEFEKCIYFVIYLYVFKLVCTLWENFIRIGITVLYLKSWRCQLWIWRSQISVLPAPLRVAGKTAFATVKSTIDTSNSSNTVLLFLKYTCMHAYSIFSININKIQIKQSQISF